LAFPHPFGHRFPAPQFRRYVSEATLSEKSLIQHMMQFYQYDFSEFEGNDLDDHGLFSYKYLDHYWVEESRTPLVVRVEGRLTGFVLVNKHSYTTQERFCIAEFFIMRKYRRKGIGREVAHRKRERGRILNIKYSQPTFNI
jgi:GNAT superfamily N-acetyltransferase